MQLFNLTLKKKPKKTTLFLKLCFHQRLTLTLFGEKKNDMSNAFCQTPARKLQGHSSTGHANSPATIVVGRAHKQKLVQPTGAAPRLVTNIAHLKKDMNMDEDLTGNHPSFIPTYENTYFCQYAVSTISYCGLCLQEFLKCIKLL